MSKHVFPLVLVVFLSGASAGIAFTLSCDGGPTEAIADVAPETQILEESDTDGVVSVRCPAGTLITGGGCDCTLSPPPATRVFGASPAGNGFVCACDGMNTATAYAICLGTPIRNTLVDSDVQLEAKFTELVAQRDLMLRGE